MSHRGHGKKKNSKALHDQQHDQQNASKTAIFYESDVLLESEKSESKVNRRTHKPKETLKHDQLNINKNYRTKWQSEE